MAHGPLTDGVIDVRTTCTNTASSAVRSARTAAAAVVEEVRGACRGFIGLIA